MGRKLSSTRKAYFPGMLEILNAAACSVFKRHNVMMYHVGWDKDDLVQLAWLQCGKYCLSEENMSKYLYLNAKRGMYLMLRSEYNRLSRCDYISLDSSFDYNDALSVVYDDSILRDIKELKYLTTRQKKIIYLYYWGGWTLRDIGQSLGYTPEGIRIQKLKALEILDQHYFKGA